MKAIRVHEFGPPEVMKLEEVPDPQPGPSQVVVRIHAVGVNPVETYIRSGIYPKPPTPYTPGADGAGIVEATGEGVTRIKVGDRVYTAGSLTGTYAEKALCKDSQVHLLPQRASFAQGAAMFVPYGTAYRGLFQRAHATPGEVVFVHGASGGVGIAAVQLARAAGMTVIGTGGTEQGRQLVTTEGAHHVLDHRAPNYLHEVLTLTNGRGADVVMEMLANVNLGNDLSIVAPGGRIVVIGNRGQNNQGTVEINPRAAMMKDASIIGMSLVNVPPPDMEKIHAALIAGLESGTLRPVIGKEVPLAEAPRAHHEVIESTAYGKIVLIP
ncbi:MAG: NADPH:quinone reductase [Candidatus Binatia bacterium]